MKAERRINNPWEAYSEPKQKEFGINGLYIHLKSISVP